MWRRIHGLITRGGGWAVAVVVLLVLVHVWVTRYVISRDRADLERDFSQARLEQIVDAAEGVEESVGEVVEDLELAGWLLAEDDSFEQREVRLKSLLGSVGSYRAAVVVDEEGRRVVDLIEQGDEVPPEVGQKAGDLATEALASDEDDAILVSRSIGTSDEEGESQNSYRAFATVVESESGGERGAVALVVDTETLFEPVELAVTDDHSLLLMTSADGSVEAPSDDAVHEVADEGIEPLEPLVEQMHDHDQGAVRLSKETAERLDLGRHEAIGAHADIHLGDRTRWRVASLTSMAALQERETKMMWRLGGVSAVIGLILFGFGTYFVVSVRRRTALTERLRAARKLALLNEKADKVLESIPAGVMVVSDDGRVTGFNRAFADRLDEATEGATLRENFRQADDEDVEDLEELVERAEREGDVAATVDEQCALFSDEGQYRIQAVPLEPSDPDERVLVVFEDFSELHQLERQLLQAEKLSTVGILAAGIAHEVGTPLGVIRGRAEYLQYKLDEDDPSRESLEIIIDQIDRVSRVIRGLLDFSREESPAISSVDVSAAVERVLELMHYELERHEIEVEVDVPASLPKLAADADELEQVLVNLVVNACDASKEGDRLRIAARPDEAADGEAEALVITIEDTGKGIPEERIHQVFDPFFTTKKRGKGTGLGLPIVAKIVRNHGGTIDIDSQPGEGTCVTIRWPTVAADVHLEEEESDDGDDQRQPVYPGGR
ncbi:MAG: two-component system sensor histidine kinase NtrB [Persicimonas sp.]